MDMPTVGLFRLAYNLISAEINEAVAEVVPHQKPSYGNVMEQLDYQDGMRLIDLAEGAGMAPQSIGELVDQLEELGMVERRPDPHDRRAKRVYVTEKAQEAQRAAFETATASDDTIARLIGQERFVQLRSDMRRIVEAFGGAVPGDESDR